MEELQEPPEPLKMKKRARLMKMETEETAGDVAWVATSWQSFKGGELVPVEMTPWSKR